MNIEEAVAITRITKLSLNQWRTAGHGLRYWASPKEKDSLSSFLITDGEGGLLSIQGIDSERIGGKYAVRIEMVEPFKHIELSLYMFGELMQDMSDQLQWDND